jgi:hypothetical protein
VTSSVVQFSPADRRVPNPSPNLLARYFDAVDAVTDEESLDLLAEDYIFEMVFPGFDGEPDERVRADKEDFKRFQASIRARRGRMQFPVAEADRRHHMRASTVANGLVLIVADTRNGRRNGTIIAAGEADDSGKMSHYLIAMSPTVYFR